MLENSIYDFAISYAGEDIGIVEKFASGLQERSPDIKIFFAPKEAAQLLGKDGTTLFENVFLQAKQIIVFISKNYKGKKWTMYEWDIIQQREENNRYIPIRLDETILSGLSSNILFEKYDENKIADFTRRCIEKLILYEKSVDFKRPSEFEKTLSSIKTDSKGSLAKAYQLVADKRKRTPLDNIMLPTDQFPISYNWDRADECYNFSTIKRLVSYIAVPRGLSESELIFNLKHAVIVKFNEFKPDATKVYASCSEIPDDVYEYNAGSAVCAPFGKWEKAEEGFAFNIPASQFEIEIDVRPIYLQHK